MNKIILSLRKKICVCAAILLFTVAIGSAAALTDKEQLGKSIFFDDKLSINENQACAACHALEVGWTGPDSEINEHGAVYEGSIIDHFGNRKPPSSGYATQSPILNMKDGGVFEGGNFWDGRATGEKLGNPAADQAQGPFLNPNEQALRDSACVVYKVFKSDYYDTYQQVWGPIDINWKPNMDNLCKKEGDPIELSPGDREKSNATYDNIALSIAAYEASPEVNQFTSKYDLYLKELTPQEDEGLRLFQGKGKCGKCHTSSGKKPLFTDYTYDNLGLPQNPENPAGVAPDFIDLGLGGFLRTRPEWAQYADINDGKHKVPTLRNVDLRPDNSDFVKAYGHNGYFKSLKEIVHFYHTRDVLSKCDEITNPLPGTTCWPDPEVAQNVNTAELGDLGLTMKEEAAIVAFLKTLSDGYMP
ncbi:MAG: cytochrome C [ANME-2 cluster archaeon]|nr:MAG: cytochrome C [ANME-2 cluster archaeon]